MVTDIKNFLDSKVVQYNRPEFIVNDPVCIPHMFIQKQDIEIMGLWASVLAWGQRVTIINKCRELIGLMDGAPYDFIMNHEESDLKKLLNFKHRTFNTTDTLYFIKFFRYHYSNNDSLETAFMPPDGSYTPFRGLGGFRSYFCSLDDFPNRTKKHISSPSQKSTCKRLNMFLRWMVRKDDCGVDFGIWNQIKPADLICPCDLHVDRVARKLGLITRKQTDWQTAIELTERLREFDPVDPVKYDFALFVLGIEENF
jgi:uncharacterized protein (TIGR02757 family)